MVQITENDLALFRERAKTELKSTGDIGRLAWDDVVEALCKEVARLRSGDCAKLREALERCANWGEQIDCQLGSSDETVYAFRDERCLAHNISECARAALSATPRNCDCFKTAAEAIDAYQDLTGDQLATDSGMKEWVEFAVWLFAPRDGEGRGRQVRIILEGTKEEIVAIYPALVALEVVAPMDNETAQRLAAIVSPKTDDAKKGGAK